MRRRSWTARVMDAAIVWWFKRQNWTVVGPVPEPRKFVVIAAPHTSNWDFLYFIGAAHALDAPLSFMGKKELFRWPFARLMRDMGGIPVDRSSSNNAVEQMVHEFAVRDEFLLTVAPEGTRGRVQQWRTGFYHIALEAKVPIVCGFMDYSAKKVGLGITFWPTGDYEKDLIELIEYYRQFTPKFPERRSPGLIERKNSQ